MQDKLFTRCSLFVFAVVVSTSLAMTFPVGATFQNWQSNAFRDPSLQNPKQEPSLKAQQDKKKQEMLDYQNPARNEASYHRSTEPKNMDQHYDYLQESHPLQEQPLPNQTVK